jgi:hypothetical protein
MKLGSILFPALIMFSAAAFAHAPKVGVNGGPQTNAGAYHVEMVIKDRTLAVYLRDHGDKPVATEGFGGTAILVIEGKSERINLTPGGDNRLTGTSTVPLPVAPTGVVRLTIPAGGTVQGQFK